MVYADQCPWHEKSAFDLLNTAMDYSIDLKLTKIKSAIEVKNGPSGFCVLASYTMENFSKIITSALRDLKIF